MRWLAVVVGLAGCHRDAAVAPGAAPARVEQVTRGALHDRVVLTGELAAGAAIDLAVPKTDVWELTIRWMADDGTLVKAGDKVLEFDNSAFTTGLEQKRLQVIEAQNAFRTFQDVSAMAIAVKQHELQQHQIALDKARLLASVPADLLPQRTAQERQLELQRAEVAVARATKELAAENQAAALEGRVKQIELDKAKRAIEAARTSIGELELHAPRDGLLVVGTHPWEGRRFQVGDTVQPGFTVLTLPDFSTPMVVRADLSDVDDGRVAVGMAGTCTLDAYPDAPVPCEVTELAPVARPKARQSLRRVFAVGLALAGGDQERMRPGMSVKVELAAKPLEALLVSRGAIVDDGKQVRVRLASGELRDVALGACDAQRCAVEGLREGEAVAVGAP